MSPTDKAAFLPKDNESTLNQAFENADLVCLISSANRSGQDFGYTVMTSKVPDEPLPVADCSALEGSAFAGSMPKLSKTSTSATAPAGRVIDDSARGTIFWEAESANREEAKASLEKDTSAQFSGEQSWKRQFSIQWKSTAGIPFKSTWGLRNP